MTVAIAAIAGSIGALGRYLFSGAVQHRASSSMPFGTAAVNLLGAFALGLVVGADQGTAVLSTAAIGFLGGFTTFSTWMIETARLGVLPKPSLQAVMNLLVLAALGVVCAALGYHLAN